MTPASPEPSSPRIGVVAGIDRERRSGEDRSEGFLIACGGRIVRGACLTAEEASTMDVGPTLLYLMGEQVPQDIDGKVLLPIVDESFRAANPVTYTP